MREAVAPHAALPRHRQRKAIRPSPTQASRSRRSHRAKTHPPNVPTTSKKVASRRRMMERLTSSPNHGAIPPTTVLRSSKHRGCSIRGTRRRSGTQRPRCGRPFTTSQPGNRPRCGPFRFRVSRPSWTPLGGPVRTTDAAQVRDTTSARSARMPRRRPRPDRSWSLTATRQRLPGRGSPSRPSRSGARRPRR